MKLMGVEYTTERRYSQMPSIDLRLGDCLDVMRSMDENSVDTIITDPPY